MVTEAQKDQIIDLSETMSIRQIAEVVGVSKSTVANILKGRGRPRKAMKGKGVQADAPAPAPATALSKVSKVSNADIVQCPTEKMKEGIVLSPSMVASVALDHLVSEVSLYHDALAGRSSPDPQVRQTAEWAVVNHERLIQGHLKIISQWFGMDKGDVLKAIEEVRADPLAGMTKEELLALYTATEGSA